MSVKTLKRIIKELDEIKKGVEDIEDGEKETKIQDVVIENLLEMHLEDLIRRNISKIFPDFEIIDGGRHYYTKNGNYLDILCKDRKDGSLVVIELKRDRSPSKALIQLLDYVNQVMEEFGTEMVKGILICQKTDRRMESALNAIRKKLKNPDDISLVEFDLKFVAQLR
ncbi:endonuclease NucS domain-containing protein [Archaeoglobus sp.]